MNRREEVSKTFKGILREMGEVHDRKQKDYGKDDDPLHNVRSSTEWGVPAWLGTMIRATDKVRRLQTYARTGKLANEGVEDAFLDLAVYSILALILFREEQNTLPPKEEILARPEPEPEATTMAAPFPPTFAVARE